MIIETGTYDSPENVTVHSSYVTTMDKTRSVKVSVPYRTFFFLEALY